MWFLTQHKRWGSDEKSTRTTSPWPNRSTRSTCTKKQPLWAKVSVPKDVMRTSKLMDGVVWDGKDPKKYADGFKIKA